MLNSLGDEEAIKSDIVELSAIITSYCNDCLFMFTLDLSGEVFDCLLGLTLQLEEINPCIS